MNLLLRSILATAMLIPFDAVVEKAEAAGAGTCSQYVKATRQLATREQAAQCGIWGGFDQNKSRRWCVSVKEETVRDAMESDRQKIGKCATCRDYSNAANQAARDNVAFRCGFTGDRWGIQGGGPNDGHFQWCMALSNTTKGFGMTYAAGFETTPWDTARGEEEGARNAGIKACIATARDRFSEREKAECEDYANTAVIMANFNANNRCGASVEGRWTLLKDQHFMWCLPRIGTNDGKAMIESETKIRETGAQACKAGGELKPNGDVLWKGRPIKTLGKNKPQNPALNPDQIDAKPDERKKLGTGRPIGAVVKHPGSGGISTSTCSDAVNRLGGGGGCGTVPNLVPQPKGGGSGGSYLSSGGNKPGAGGTTPAATAPANDSPIKRLGKSGPDNNIDFGGRPPPSTGTKIR